MRIEPATITFVDELGRILASTGVVGHGLKIGERRKVRAQVKRSGLLHGWITLTENGTVLKGELTEDVSDLNRLFAYHGLQVHEGQIVEVTIQAK